ncbi:MAG: transposase [Bacteroidales bacterium]|jgi:SLT domain-containing protein|nr:transposase [Bacteroidales bacterium]
MISKDKECKLIEIYFYVSEKFEKELKFYSERFSNNSKPEFSDEEVMTVYLYIMHHEQQFKIKHIHRFASEYLRSWFPRLPSYQAFNNRLNRLHTAFSKLTEILLSEFQPEDCCLDQSLLDSMPIITCSGKRTGKVAKEITDKGFNSTKGFYYYGLKLHALGFRRIGKLPHPEQILFTPASVNDLSLYKEAWSKINNRVFYGDKIYNDKDFFINMKNEFDSEMLTPVKGVKGMSDALKKFNKAADDLFSTAVSRVRQPIEALFNWIIEKADIQRASKVRSTKGLLVHIFGKLATAYIHLIF